MSRQTQIAVTAPGFAIDLTPITNGEVWPNVAGYKLAYFTTALGFTVRREITTEQGDLMLLAFEAGEKSKAAQLRALLEITK